MIAKYIARTIIVIKKVYAPEMTIKEVKDNFESKDSLFLKNKLELTIKNAFYITVYYSKCTHLGTILPN